MRWHNDDFICSNCRSLLMTRFFLTENERHFCDADCLRAYDKALRQYAENPRPQRREYQLQLNF